MTRSEVFGALNCVVGGSVPPKSDTYLASAPLIHTFVSLHVMTYTPGDVHTSSIRQRALHAYPSRFVLCLLWPNTYESFFQYKNFGRDEFPLGLASKLRQSNRKRTRSIDSSQSSFSCFIHVEMIIQPQQRHGQEQLTLVASASVHPVRSGAFDTSL